MMLDKPAHARFQARAASHFHLADFVWQRGARAHLERLTWLKQLPQHLLEWGTKTKFVSEYMQSTHPSVNVAHVEYHQNFVDQLSRQGVTVHKITESGALPFDHAYFDAILLNFTIVDFSDFSPILLKVRDYLKSGGLLMFTALGQDSLLELRQAFNRLHHVHPFIDMHHIGDALPQLGFVDPVVDCDRFVIDYTNLNALFRDLRYMGAQNALIDRSRGLLTPRAWQKMLRAYQEFRVDDCYPAHIEMILGHAWKGDLPQFRDEQGATRVPLEGLKKKHYHKSS